MCAEDSGRTIGRDRFFKHASDNTTLATTGNREDEFGHTKQCRNSDRYGPCRNVLKCLEPTFGGLLLPGSRVQMDDLHIFGIIEICFSRIVECEMPIFSDSQLTYLGIRLKQFFGVFATHCFGIDGASVVLDKFPHSDPLGEILSQIAAERAWVIRINPNIFIEMKSSNALPR